MYVNFDEKYLEIPKEIIIYKNNQNIFTGIVKELEFLGSNIRGHIEVSFKSQTDIVICNFASEYIQNNNIQKDTSVNISLQPHAIKIVKD